MTCNTMGRNGGLGGIVYKKFQPISAAVESVLHIPVKEVHSSTLHHLEGQVLEFYIPRWIRPILSPVVIKNRTYLRLLASEVDYKTQWPITLLERTAVATWEVNLPPPKTRSHLLRLPVIRVSIATRAAWIPTGQMEMDMMLMESPPVMAIKTGLTSSVGQSLMRPPINSALVDHVAEIVKSPNVERKMQSIKVYVDGLPVTLDIHEGDDVSSIACELEGKGYNVSAAFPKVSADGKKLSFEDLFQKVNLSRTYEFGK